VAKILVADDNSNVQKTVALALADLGIEVVAVNNGDAAVRKLPDVNPDLVLADIFMPVRNGYEVCDYVKKDSRFSHVPVVLLVGAFDPLDEREAQRVGADGILKKPFVPPDPLIAMVKTLLERSLGDRLVTVAAPKPAAMEQNSASVATRGSANPAKVAERPPAPPRAPEPAHEQAAEEEFQAPVDRVSFGEGEHPIAFGQLLETPAKDFATSEAKPIEPVEMPVEDDQVITSARDANLGEPIFWKPEEPEAEADETQSESEDEDSPDFSSSSRSWGLGEAALEQAASKSAHPDGVQPAQPVEPVEPIEPFELVRDETEEYAAPPTIVEKSSLVVQDAAAQASLTVQPGRASDVAASPLDWMATAPPQPEGEVPEEAETPWNAGELAAEEQDEVSAAEESDQSDDASSEIGRESTLPHPPPLGVMPAPSFLGMPAPPAAPPAPPQAKTATPATDPLKTTSPFKRLDQSADDTARSIPKQEWVDLAESLELKPPAPPQEKPKASPPIPAAAPPPFASPAPVSDSSSETEDGASAESAPDPALVEAVVQRVLDKMRPQVVDIITKEFLRPVVQALVHREITKH
jgi:CheY-like chemotaxis protein